MSTLRFTAPTADATFTISADATWPKIVFRTDGIGSHTWQWTLTWGAFSQSGQVASVGNEWDATATLANLGGTLTVSATASGLQANITALVRGTNPSAAQVLQYLATHVGSDGFDKILTQESKLRHFNNQGEPIRSFDDGYGMCQLTKPAPAFADVWNWQRNLDAGLRLFAQKRAAAQAYLGQSARSYTDDQLKRETVCRWNGGSYHVWDAVTGAWVRNANILCDSATGNIGWDMTDAANSGQTEAQLRARDRAAYSAPRTASSHWKYLGVCYADHVLR